MQLQLLHAAIHVRLEAQCIAAFEGAGRDAATMDVRLGRIVKVVGSLLRLYSGFRSSVGALADALESDALSEVRRATERDSRCAGRPVSLFLRAPLARPSVHMVAL